MIRFSSRATGVDYPFEKYDQVAVRDFIFGGQENVSATTLTDEALHDAQAEIDDPTTTLVAHELGQHWFGDYAQGRDWANIWLNEGFATYITALYTQYHDSNDAYRYEIFNDQNAALEVEASRAPRPLVHRNYVDPLDTLKEITHDKGASVLDMMRYVLDGNTAMQSPASQNETLFQALNYYLTTHAAQTADSTELLRSIWTKTGNGRPVLLRVGIQGRPSRLPCQRHLRPRQKGGSDQDRSNEQANANTPVFDMPIPLAFFGGAGQRVETRVRDYSAEQEFTIPLPFAPSWVDFDPDDILYKAVVFDKTDTKLSSEALGDPHMMSRLWAVHSTATS